MPVIALAGNPNVGKSTVFNALTGLKQHTGNWCGKTVGTAKGIFSAGGRQYTLVDLPGTYSLMARSAEEEAARNYICFEEPDAVIVVCDACCLERNLNLVLQTAEITEKVIVCVNLLDDAGSRGVAIKLEQLAENLGLPVAGTSATKGEGLTELVGLLERVLSGEMVPAPLPIRYPAALEDAAALLIPTLKRGFGRRAHWLALRLLEDDRLFIDTFKAHNSALYEDSDFLAALESARALLIKKEFSPDMVRDKIVSSIVLRAEEAAMDSVEFSRQSGRERDQKLDRLLMGRATGYPIMVLLLMLVFWLTISGANVPSNILAGMFAKLGEFFAGALVAAAVPELLREILIDGVWRVLSWVVAVMLPPMAIFFPLFTLLEDSGYLPRVAFNLDRMFKSARACGKQALTM